ncbi:OmpA family protein [Ralstonia sp. 1138]|uniref:OmpA family protein n=1 Tax=Ralstonia sp. 1138 TaxID=3156423 RepID=UPI003396B8A9
MTKPTILALMINAGLFLAGCASDPMSTVRAMAMQDGQQIYKVSCYGPLEGAEGTCQAKAKEVCDQQANGLPVYPLKDPAPLDVKVEDKNAVSTLLFQCGEPKVKAAVLPAPAPVVAAPVAAPAPANKVSLASDATFDTDKATLRPRARARLDKFASDAQGMAFDRITVAGYTDARGPDKHNRALSERRAQTVSRYLKAHGMKARAYEVHGYGKAHPVASNATAQGRAQNRRVEIKLEGTQGQ